MPKEKSSEVAGQAAELVPGSLSIKQYAIINIVAAIAAPRNTTARDAVTFALQVVEELERREVL